MEKLVLIDGNSLINRAFYALPVLSTSDGVYTNGVYGFLNMLFKIITDHNPTHVAVAFDLKAPTFRHKIYAEYKGTRKPMPNELRPQIPLLKSLLMDMNIAVLEKEGFEADDIIGTIAKHTDVKTLIFTGDKDSFQLVDEQTDVYFTKRGITDIEVYSLSNFTEKTTIIPSQIVELKALMGDASDNIPGVMGCGEKTAKTLLHTYQTIENLYAHTDELTGKLKEKIVNGKESAFLSKTLATIDTNCGIDCNLDNFVLTFPFPIKVKGRFIELQLKSLASRESFFVSQTSTTNDGEPSQEMINGENADYETTQEKITQENTAQSVSPITVVKVEDLAVAKEIDFTKEFAFVFTNEAINLYSENTEYVFPICEQILGDGFRLSAVLEAIKDLFVKPKNLIVFDKKELRHRLKNLANYDITCPVLDVAITNYLTDFVGGAERLNEVILKFNLSVDTVAYSLYTVYYKQLEKLKEQDLTDLYFKVELPLADVLFDMESSGFKVDGNALYQAGEEYRKQLKEIEDKIRTLANEPNLNVNSPKQLGETLFVRLNVGKGKKTKTGYSTSAEVLEELEDKHPIIPLILEFRKIQKILSTYIDGFKPLIEKPSGLIHTSFNQTVTSTGRLSSKEPNLQNIPVRDELGRNLRKFFVPKSDDRVLISADYSQIELRLLASFSKTDGLIKAFNDGVDIHTETASKVFGVPLDAVTKEMRSKAKAVNFGIIYGISSYGLAKNIKTSPKEAGRYIKNYFEEFPQVKEYMNKNVAFAKKTGYSLTVLNRRRYIREIQSMNKMMQAFGERAAMNMPLQGSSADIIKLAMLGVSKRLKAEKLKSELILQIHDELIIDAFISEKEQVTQLLVEEMENAVKLLVPLTVSVGCGKTWYEAK